MGRLGLPQFGGGAVMGRGGVHAYREAVVGEKVRDRVAPFGGVGGQGRAAEEAGETGGCGDGLGSHIQALDFQPREPPEAVGNLGEEGREGGETDSEISLGHLDPGVPEISLDGSAPGQLLKSITTRSQTLAARGLSDMCPGAPSLLSPMGPQPDLPSGPLAHPRLARRSAPPALAPWTRRPRKSPRGTPALYPVRTQNQELFPAPCFRGGD